MFGIGANYATVSAKKARTTRNQRISKREKLSVYEKAVRKYTKMFGMNIFKSEINKLNDGEIKKLLCTTGDDFSKLISVSKNNIRINEDLELLKQDLKKVGLTAVKIIQERTKKSGFGATLECSENA